jgi:hypothetical protein
MSKQIKVNGQNREVINSLSSGPGAQAHTYEIKGGYVYEIAGQWKLQVPGQYPVPVTVEA